MGGLECRAGSRRRRKIFRRGNVGRVLSMTRTRGAAAAFVDARLGVNLHARGVCFAVIHPTRGVGGMGVRSKWNLMRRLIRSRLRLLLPHQFPFRDRSKSNKSARRREPCSCATIKSRFFRTSRRYTGPQGTAAAGNVRGTRQYVIRDSPRVSRRRQFRTRTSEPEHFLHSAAPFAAKTPFDARQPLVLSHPHFAHVCPSGAWEGAWGKRGQSSRRDGDQTEERLRRENGNGCASPRD